MSTVQTSYTLTDKTRLEISQGDLTQAPVDAIVNAANENLAHGGGIAAAIVRAGGRIIQQESDDWVRAHGPVPHAQPAYTQGGRLPARYIIHAVGPIWKEGSASAVSAGARTADANLASAITGSLQRAEELGLHSIAFPAISTGIFGFPKQRAARIFFETIKAYFAEGNNTVITLVQIILWDDESLRIFLAESKSVLRHQK